MADRHSAHMDQSGAFTWASKGSGGVGGGGKGLPMMDQCRVGYDRGVFGKDFKRSLEGKRDHKWEADGWGRVGSRTNTGENRYRSTKESTKDLLD